MRSGSSLWTLYTKWHPNCYQDATYSIHSFVAWWFLAHWVWIFGVTCCESFESFHGLVRWSCEAFFASPRLDPIVVHYPQVCIAEKCRWSICTWKFGPCFERRRNPKEGALACASHPTLRCWWYGCLLMLWNWTYGFQKTGGGHYCR